MLHVHCCQAIKTLRTHRNMFPGDRPLTQSYSAVGEMSTQYADLVNETREALCTDSFVKAAKKVR